MNILTIIIVGGFVGWLATQLMGRETGIFGSIIVGIIGSFIGGFVSDLITGSNQSYLAFSWIGIFWSFIGALILVAIVNALSSHPQQHHTGL